MLMFLTGKDIATIRHGLAMNLREFGELLGVTEAAVCLWESGKRRPRYEMMERLNQVANQRIETALPSVNGVS